MITMATTSGFSHVKNQTQQLYSQPNSTGSIIQLSLFQGARFAPGELQCCCIPVAQKQIESIKMNALYFLSLFFS